MVFTATAAVLLDGEAFNRLVAEEDLRTWEQAGYVYTKKRGKSGIELYRTYGPKWCWLYTARRVATQANAGGGSVVIDITIAAGMSAQLVSADAINSGSNGLNWRVADEDNAVHTKLSAVGAGAGTQSRIPSIGSAATGSDNILESAMLRFGPGQKLYCSQTAAGAQNDTLTVAVSLLLPISAASDGSDISWSVARSTNAGDVTLAASTISAANTMQAVLLP